MPWLVALKPRPHQQQRRSNIVECYKSNDSFDKVDRCFDIVALLATMLPKNGKNVAVFGNNVEVSSFWQSGNKLNMFNLFRFCRKDEILRQTGSTSLPVASRLLLLWAGLNGVKSKSLAGNQLAAQLAGLLRRCHRPTWFINDVLQAWPEAGCSR